MTAATVCGNAGHFGPPGMPPEDSCNNIAQGNLCRTQHGQCLPLDCASITDQATCGWENKTHPLPHCAWQPAAGECVDFGGDCTRLHAQEPCLRLEAYGVCRWDSESGSCASGRGNPMTADVDCAGWPDRTLGTMDHHLHILLANVRTWNQTSPAVSLAKVLARVVAPEANPITPQQIFQYWEANIVGAPLYPDGVKMLIGNFAELFGTPLGSQLQAWCESRGWPLVWALGTGTGGDGMGMGGQQTAALYFNRSLDPLVLAAAGTNISLPSDAAAAFQDLWRAVETARAQAPPPPPPSPGHPPSRGGPVLPLPAVMKAWAALPAALGVESLSARACSAGAQCVGVRTVDRDCVCTGRRSERGSIKTDDHAPLRLWPDAAPGERDGMVGPEGFRRPK